MQVQANMLSEVIRLDAGEISLDKGNISTIDGVKKTVSTLATLEELKEGSYPRAQVLKVFTTSSWKLFSKPSKPFRRVPS